MMRQTILLVVAVLWAATTAFGQVQPSVWLLPDSVRLDFGVDNIQVSVGNGRWNHSSPSYHATDSVVLFRIEKYACSNELMYGKMLSYDGISIQDGDSLIFSQSCGACALTIVESDSLIFYFSLVHEQSSISYWQQVPKKIYINKIVNHNNFPQIILKNYLIFQNNLSEASAAVKHSNGKDWWTLFHSSEYDTFFVFRKINSNYELSHIQKIGRNYNDTGDPNYALYSTSGEMVFSEDGNKLAAQSMAWTLNVFEFDRCTGLLGNPIDLGMPSGYPWQSQGHIPEEYAYYGMSFSPDGTKLYASSLEGLYQFDLSMHDPLSTKTLIFSRASMVHPSTFAQHQLGVDGKIYIAHGNVAGCFVADWVPYYYLSVVNTPNEPGDGCNFQYFGFYLNGLRAVDGLPNLPNYELDPLIGEVAQAGPDTTVCPSDSVQLGSPPAREGLVFEWEPAHGLSCNDCPQPLVSPVADTRYKLTVRDTLSDLGAECAWTYDAVWVKVPHEDLSAGFSYSPDTFAEAPYTVALVSQTPELENVWVVGSDTIRGQMIDYVFPDTGRYAVKLIVRDTFGCAVDWTVDTLRIVRDTVTGKAAMADALLRIRPNPSSGLVTVEVPDGVKECELSVYDLRGVAVHTVTLAAGTGSILDLSPLPPGAYTFVFRLDGRRTRIHRQILLK